MNDTGASTTESVTSNDVTVYTTVEKEEFGVPTVVLRLESAQDGPVQVRLRERLPPNVAVDSIAFHPDYRSDDWSVTDDTLQFETELGANGETTTMFAVQELSSEQADAFLDNLDVEDVERLDPDETGAIDPTPSAGGVPEPSTPDQPGEPDTDWSETLRDDDNGESGERAEGATAVSANASDPSPSSTRDRSQAEENGQQSAADENAASGGDDDRTDGTDQPTAPRSGGDDATADSDHEPTPDEATTEGAAERVAGSEELSAVTTAELVEEIERRLDAGDVPDETEAELREQVAETGDKSVASLEQRVLHLQQRMSDLEAFGASVEAVHDQYGSPLEAFEELESEVRSLSEEVDTLRDSVETIDGQTEELRPRVDTLETDVEDVAATVSTVEEDVSTIEDEQETLKSEVSELAEWRAALRNSLANLMDDSS